VLDEILELTSSEEDTSEDSLDDAASLEELTSLEVPGVHAAKASINTGNKINFFIIFFSSLIHYKYILVNLSAGVKKEM